VTIPVANNNTQGEIRTVDKITSDKESRN